MTTPLIVAILLCITYSSAILTCPDKTMAISKGLHTCCEQEPFIYCILCERIARGHTTTCTGHCNGTVIGIEPYCIDCQCYAVKTVDNKPKKERGGGCPYRRS